MKYHKVDYRKWKRKYSLRTGKRECPNCHKLYPLTTPFSFIDEDCGRMVGLEMKKHKCVANPRSSLPCTYTPATEKGRKFWRDLFCALSSQLTDDGKH